MALLKRQGSVIVLFGFLMLVQDVFTYSETINGAIRVDSSSWGQRVPAIKRDSRGTVYIAWEDYRYKGSRLRLAKLQNGNFSYVLVDSIGSGDILAQCYPDMDIDLENNLCITWTEWRYGEGRAIYFSKSINGGQSFLPSIRVDNDNLGSQFEPSIAIDNNGYIHIAWQDYRHGYYQIYYTKSINGGQSFLPSIGVAPRPNFDQFAPSLSVDSKGNPHIAWQDYSLSSLSLIYYTKSTDGGQSFLPPFPIYGESDEWSASLQIDCKDNPCIAFIHCGFWNADLYFSRSINGGQSFPDPICVHGDVQVQTLPDLILDMEDNPFIVWQDHYIDPYLSRVFFTKSIDTGISFLPGLALSHSLKNQSCPCLDIDKEGTFYVAWEDWRHDYAQIYFTQKAYPTGINETKIDNFLIYFSVNPNPVSLSVSIKYQLSIARYIELAVYDATGRLIKILTKETKHPGKHETCWDGRDGDGKQVSCGNYFLRLKTGELTKTQKLVLIR